MPFVTISAQPPPGATGEACAAVAGAVAAALDLPPAGVYAQHVTACRGRTGAGEPVTFAVLDIYGRQRPAEATAAAVHAAVEVAAAQWRCEPSNVHVHWHTPHSS